MHGYAKSTSALYMYMSGMDFMGVWMYAVFQWLQGVPRWEQWVKTLTRSAESWNAPKRDHPLLHCPSIPCNCDGTFAAQASVVSYLGLFVPLLLHHSSYPETGGLHLAPLA